jgi:hypothetical protein
MEQDQRVGIRFTTRRDLQLACGGCADIYYRLRSGSGSVRVLKLSATGGKKDGAKRKFGQKDFKQIRSAWEHITLTYKTASQDCEKQCLHW